MCLIVNQIYPRPEDGAIRWKMMRRGIGGSLSWVNSTNHPHYTDLTIGSILRMSVDRRDYGYSAGHHGIHVCVDEERVYNICTVYLNGGYDINSLVKVMVKCQGFLAGGKFLHNLGNGTLDHTHETWESVEILSIQDFDLTRIKETEHKASRYWHATVV